MNVSPPIVNKPAPHVNGIPRRWVRSGLTPAGYRWQVVEKDDDLAVGLRVLFTSEQQTALEAESYLANIDARPN